MRQTVAGQNRRHAAKAMHTSKLQAVFPKMLAKGVQFDTNSQSMQPILHTVGGVDMQSEYSK